MYRVGLRRPVPGLHYRTVAEVVASVGLCHCEKKKKVALFRGGGHVTFGVLAWCGGVVVGLTQQWWKGPETPNRHTRHILYYCITLLLIVYCSSLL